MVMKSNISRDLSFLVFRWGKELWEVRQLASGQKDLDLQLSHGPLRGNAKEQLEGQGTTSKDVAPLSERGQIPLKSSPLQTCLCFPGHLILLILVWANGGIWSQEITTETIHSSLPPGLLGAKETRTEGPFEKEGLRPGGLEQGFLSVTREVILGRHRHITKLHGITQEGRHLLF